MIIDGEFTEDVSRFDPAYPNILQKFDHKGYFLTDADKLKLKKKSKKPKIVQINKQDVELCCGGCMKKASKMADAEKFEFLRRK